MEHKDNEVIDAVVDEKGRMLRIVPREDSNAPKIDLVVETLRTRGGISLPDISKLLLVARNNKLATQEIPMVKLAAELERLGRLGIDLNGNPMASASEIEAVRNSLNELKQLFDKNES